MDRARNMYVKCLRWLLFFLGFFHFSWYISIEPLAKNVKSTHKLHIFYIFVQMFMLIKRLNSMCVYVVALLLQSSARRFARCKKCMMTMLNSRYYSLKMASSEKIGLLVGGTHDVDIIVIATVAAAAVGFFLCLRIKSVSLGRKCRIIGLEITQVFAVVQMELYIRTS